MLSLQIFSHEEDFFSEPFDIPEMLQCREQIHSVSVLLERIFRDPPDLLLLDLPQNVLSTVELLTLVCRLPLEHPPRLFLIADSAIPFRLPEQTVFCFCRPVNRRTILERICLFSDSETAGRPSLALGDRICSDLLLRLGVSPRLQGFEMLRLGVQYLLRHPKRTDVKIMYDLYPAIAKQTETSVSIVEHAMRHAIETGWMRADLEELEAFIGYTTRDYKPTPSNSAFLFMLTERVSMRLYGYGKTSDIAHWMRSFDG